MWSSNASVPSLGKGGGGKRLGGEGAGRQQQAVFLPSVVFASHLPHLKLHPGSCLARGRTSEKEGDCTSFLTPCSSPTHLQPHNILSPSLSPSNPHSILISISISVSFPSCPHSYSHPHPISNLIPSLSTPHFYIHPIPTASPSHLQPHPIPISTPSHPSHPHSLPIKGSPSAPSPTEGGSPRRSERAQHWGPRGPSISSESSQGCWQCGEAELSAGAGTQSWVSATCLMPEALLHFSQLQALWGHSMSL